MNRESRKPRSRWMPALVLSAVVLSGGSPADTAPGAEFSRSRWLAERAARMPVEGNAARGLEPPLPAKRGRVLPAGAGGRSVRVSFDLLAPDDGAAQPETQAEPFLAVDPENDRNLLAGYQESRFVNGGARALTFAVSRDGGRVWREGLVPGLTLATGGRFERASDPWVAFGPGGRAYYVSLAFDETTPRNGIFVSASNDGGRSWAEPVAVHENLGLDFDDKEAGVVDVGAGSPWRGRVYVCWDTVTDDRRQILRVSSSDDGAQSWTAPTDIAATDFNIGCLPLVSPGGALHIVWLRVARGSGAATLLIARSEDGGASFGEPVEIARMQNRGVAALRTGELPAAAVDPRNGRLFVVWPDSRFTPADQIVMASSSDGGASWSEPRRFSDGPDDAPSFTPAVAVDGRGRVGVSYYSLRNDPARAFAADLYLVESDARGRPRKARRISPTSFDARDAAVTEAGFFFGDYQGLVGLRSGFLPLWIGTAERSALDPARRQSDAVVPRMRL